AAPRRLAPLDPAPLGDTHQLLDVPEGALRRAEPGRGQLRHPLERRAPGSREDIRDERDARDLQHRRPPGRQSDGLGRDLPRTGGHGSRVQLPLPPAPEDDRRGGRALQEPRRAAPEGPGRGPPGAGHNSQGPELHNGEPVLLPDGGRGRGRAEAPGGGQRGLRLQDHDPGGRGGAEGRGHARRRLFPGPAGADRDPHQYPRHQAEADHIQEGVAHARLDTFNAVNVQVYWYDELTRDLYLHMYKKEHGFFVREEMGRRFQEATVLAFYGSALELDKTDADRISGLVEGVS